MGFVFLGRNNNNRRGGQRRPTVGKPARILVRVVQPQRGQRGGQVGRGR